MTITLHMWWCLPLALFLISFVFPIWLSEPGYFDIGAMIGYIMMLGFWLSALCVLITHWFL